MIKRGNGILLHVSSLPSKYGIGDFGPEAYRFVDFLSKTGQKYWQILPLNPTQAIDQHSPYSCSSAFAGNELFISIDLLIKDGWLSRSDLKGRPSFSNQRAEFDKAQRYKARLLNEAYENFKRTDKETEMFQEFCGHHAYWLEDFALFLVMKEVFLNKMWCQWPRDIRDRKPRPLQYLIKKHEKNLEKIKFVQYVFFKQWDSLRAYCQKKHIKIMGDIPIYVTYNSSDVWSHPDIFKLQKNRKPKFIGGVPPDYFSSTGQRWGNPVYDWKRLRGRKYEWWVKRAEHNLKLYDFIRIDHFRGFAAYWQISAKERTAVRGRWVKVPGNHFFKRLKGYFPKLPIIAEDIGYITPDVRRLMKQFDFPGMRIIQFAFGNGLAKNIHLPHNYTKNCIVYTGTHDNNTIQGWFKYEATQKDKNNISRYLKKTISQKNIHWELIELVMKSAANVVIIPMQDLLGAGGKARMNKPASHKGNWRWRLQRGELNSSLKKKLFNITKKFKRF